MQAVVENMFSEKHAGGNSAALMKFVNMVCMLAFRQESTLTFLLDQEDFREHYVKSLFVLMLKYS